MLPCLTRCIDCLHADETPKRLICKKGYFDVKINDGLLLVPFDFECIDFTRKEEKDGKEEFQKTDK